MLQKVCLCLGIFLLLQQPTQGQQDSSMLLLPTKSIQKYINGITSKQEAIETHIDKANQKIVTQLEKQEKQLQKKLYKLDSVAAKQLFNPATSISNKLKQKTSKQTQQIQEYIPKLDTLQTSLAFLQQKGSSLLQNNKAKEALTSIKDLQSKLQEANTLKDLIKERKAALQAVCKQYNITNALKGYSKKAYYYQQQVQEYKTLLSDSKKLEQRAIAELTKLPIFQQFMQQNSQLASLFRLPGSEPTTGNASSAIAGLQTRTQVQQLLQNQFGNIALPSTGGVGGGSPQQFFQQQIETAQTALSNAKEKALAATGLGEEGALDMPNFKPNKQKTKSFFKRLEYGFNVQSTKTNRWLPAETDFALTVGYKLNDKSIIGIGAAYKMGWGKPLNDIKITNEGVGFRSFIEINLSSLFPSLGGARGGSNGIWLTGGYEQNYMKGFEKIPLLDDYSKWQQSGLIGLSKKYKIGKKAGNMQLLWDFLSKQHLPQSQEIIFRTGLNF